MEELKNLQQIIGIKNFNDLIATFISGDHEYIHDSLIEGTAITQEKSNYFEDISKAGYNISNFPYQELREYCEQVENYLTNNLIIPL